VLVQTGEWYNPISGYCLPCFFSWTEPMVSEADDSDTDEEYKDSEDNHDSAEARPGVFYLYKG